MLDDSEDPISIYQREVSLVPRITRGREFFLARQIRAGGPDRDAAKKELVESHLFLVIPIAKSYPDKTIQLLDLIQQGNMGLLKAADEYDPERDYPFSAFADEWVRRAMRDTPRSIPPSTYPHNQIQ